MRLLNAQDRTEAEGARDHALLLTMLLTSLRVSEVRNLRVSSVLWSHGHWAARVKVKGGRERTIPFPKDVKQAPALASDLAQSFGMSVFHSIFVT